MNKKEIINAMKSTYQIQDKLTIYQHGIDVLKETKNIIKRMKCDDFDSLPIFLKENKNLILKELVDNKTLFLYCIYHDCGKPFCKPDSQIKFKDHEIESYMIIKKIFPHNSQLHELVSNDMKIHKVRSCNFEDFIKTPNLITHIIVGYAELMANSKMFGGVNSDSFKIKYKNYEKFSKRALSLLK